MEGDEMALLRLLSCASGHTCNRQDRFAFPVNFVFTGLLDGTSFFGLTQLVDGFSGDSVL